MERGFWGWSPESGFPTTWADHYPRPLAQLSQDPETAVGSPLCVCVYTCVCKLDPTLLILAVVVQS